MGSRPDRIREARRRQLEELAGRLRHPFADIGLLDRALCHASTGNEGKLNYERLEFLGDAFLNFAVAEALFQQTPEIPEGQLTETRATLVSRKPLAAVARQLELASHLETGKGLRDAERASERILADLVEAVLGAILLDGGVRSARAFVKRFILAKLPEGKVATEPVIDAKTRLLHHCQRQKIGQPRYELLEAIGLQHDQEFRVVVKLATGVHAEGRARTKRAAEKLAADALLAQLAAGQKA